MKISYTTGYSTYTSLGDESDRSALIEEFAPSFGQLAQVEPLLRASTPKVLGRGNASCQLSVLLVKTYSSQANALAAIVTLRGILASPLHLKVEQDATTHYYPNANCTNYAPVLRGLSVAHQMTWITQDVTGTAPTANPG